MTDTNRPEKPEVGASLPDGEARFRHLCDTAPVMIWTAGADALRDFFNKHWLDFRGRTMEEELGDGWAEGVHPEDFDRCREVYSTSFEARESFQMQYRLRRSDGAYRWLLDSGVPRCEENGTFMGFIGSCVDITERVEAEAERERLARAVQEVTERQRETLKEVMAAVTQDRLRLCETRDDLPALLNPDAESMVLTLTSIAAFRDRVRRAAREVGLSPERQQDLETAVTEAAANAVTHAGGRGRGRVGVKGYVQVWIEDDGPGIAPHALPRAALERGYSSAGTFGHGFWMMLQTADRIYLLTGPDGTTVVLEQENLPPLADWRTPSPGRIGNGDKDHGVGL